MSTELASLLHAGSLCRVIATPRPPDARRAEVADFPLFVRTESPLRPLGPGPRNSRSSDTKCGPYTFRTGRANLPVMHSLPDFDRFGKGFHARLFPNREIQFP